MLYILLLTITHCARCEQLLKKEEPFLTGEMRFFEGDFDSALFYYNKVSILSPYANDAIFRILLIREIDREILEIYANSEFEISKGNFDKGIKYAREGVALSASSQSYAGLLLAKAYKGKGELAMAVQSLLDMEALEPEGLFIPYLLREAGAMYEEMGRVDSAIEIYERLCLQFPDSPIVPIVEGRLKQLLEDQ